MRKSNFDFKTKGHKVLPPHKQPPLPPSIPSSKHSSEDLYAPSAPYELEYLARDDKRDSESIATWPMATQVKKQISAPDYYHSLAHNEAPPFRKPEKEPVPRILVGMFQLVTKLDVIDIVVANSADSDRLLNKTIHDILHRVTTKDAYREIDFLTLLVKGTLSYSAQREFPCFKLEVLLSAYLTTHKYFKWYYWNSARAVWDFFKDLIIRHTIDDTPDGTAVFEPPEAYDILTHFHTLYICNLPLIHILTFGVTRLRLCWRFTPSVKK